jgi:hypothetical protein
VTSSEPPPAAEAAGPALRAAAVVDDGRCDVDALLARVVERQRGLGRRVRGLVMTYPDAGLGCARAMVLVDVETRQEYLVSQPLGRDATGCRADPQGFARASEVLRRAAAEAPELVVCNRFGGLEAGGGGFCAELLELMLRELPLLTVVAERHLPAWRQFTGGAASLPAEPEAIAAWLASAMPRTARVPQTLSAPSTGSSTPEM